MGTSLVQNPGSLDSGLLGLFYWASLSIPSLVNLNTESLGFFRSLLGHQGPRMVLQPQVVSPPCLLEVVASRLSMAVLLSLSNDIAYPAP